MTRPPVNRRLLLWLFLGMAGVSFGLWFLGRDRAERGEGWDFIKPLTISFNIDRKASEEKSRVDETKKTREFVEKLEGKLAGATGRWGIGVFRIEEEKGYGINEKEVFPAASIMKVPIMAAVYKEIEKGEMKLDDSYILEEGDKRYGSGPLEFVKAGSSLTIERMLSEMGKKSDNTAPVVLSKLVGWDKVKTMISDLGMGHTDFEENTITVSDLEWMWEKIFKNEVLSSASREMMWENLVESIYEERIPAGLPEGVAVVHKVGTGDGVWADSGIVIPQESSTESQISNNNQAPIIITVLNEGVKRAEAEVLVPELVRMIWEFENGN